MLMDAHVGEGGVKNGRKSAHVINVRPLSTTVKPGVSKLFGKHKKVYYRQVIYAENEILGNIKCL